MESSFATARTLYFTLGAPVLLMRAKSPLFLCKLGLRHLTLYCPACNAQVPLKFSYAVDIGGKKSECPRYLDTWPHSEQASGTRKR